MSEVAPDFAIYAKQKVFFAYSGQKTNSAKSENYTEMRKG
jgi:hypothetical protein